MSTKSESFFSVSTIKAKPGKMDQVLEAMAEVAKATLEKEPGAKIYRYYKTEGQDELVCMEKFESREAYKAHQQSEHVQQWAKKYLFDDLDLFDGSFIFHHLDEKVNAGGFDRQ